MSTTMQGIDARFYLVGWLKGVTDMFAADVMAIPEDKWQETFGGCTRPSNSLAADAISMLNWTASAIKGEVMGSEDYMNLIGATTQEVLTREAAVEKIKMAAEALAEAITSASDERLNEAVPAPWGMPTPLFTLAHIAVSHIWYHDGQFNYVHCLLGDGKVYWMGD